MGLGTGPTGNEEAARVVSGSFTAIGPSGQAAAYDGINVGGAVPPNFMGAVNVALWGSVSPTITTTISSTSATISSATGVAVGQTIVSANIVPGTTIVGLSGTTVTLSTAAIASGSTVASKIMGGVTFSATVQLQRSFDGGATWITISEDTTGTLASYTAEMNGLIYEPEQGVQYRFNCTAYTSGTINYRISQASYVLFGGQ